MNKGHLPGRAMYRKILVGYDGSQGAEVAILHAIMLAKSLGGQVTAVWVHEDLVLHGPPIAEVKEEKRAADESLRILQSKIDELGHQHGIQIRFEGMFGHPAKSIVQAAEAFTADLIVLGHSGHSGLWGRLLGNTADRVSEHANCSVLIVRERSQ
jgi:nucleotide-binding universal stress UspA family protein